MMAAWGALLRLSIMVLEEGSSEPKSVTLKELVGGKRAVLFGLPGGH